MDTPNPYEIRTEKPVSKSEFERIKQLLDLAEESFVAQDPAAE